MAEKDNQSKSGEQRLGRKFNRLQYNILKRCSDKRNVTEWNEWRKEYPNEKILLEGAHLENARLVEAHLENADLRFAYLENANLAATHLEGANLSHAHLENAYLSQAHLENVDLFGIHLKNASLAGAHLENAQLWEAHLENANIKGAHLENVDLMKAHLKKADFMNTNLENTKLWEANLQGTNFKHAKLQGADFSGAIVDGETLIWGCEIDRNTKCEGVGLDSARVQPQIKQLLEYNIRWMNWERWYRGKSEKRWVVKLHQLLTYPVRLFWSISDYGLRTWRIILWFFGLAIVFAFAYFFWPNCIMVYGSVGEITGFVHALYFSVVTMTTLGFGDIAANPDSWQGQVLLMVQVIFGYVLLGALVTRFAVLFTSGGPAGKFAEE